MSSTTRDSYLVIGGSGFLGRHIVEALLARKDVVSVLDIVQKYHDTPFYSADISDQSQVSDAISKVCYFQSFALQCLQYLMLCWESFRVELPVLSIRPLQSLDQRTPRCFGKSTWMEPRPSSRHHRSWVYGSWSTRVQPAWHSTARMSSTPTNVVHLPYHQWMCTMKRKPKPRNWLFRQTAKRAY